jgi:hypothetical protein
MYCRDLSSVPEVAEVLLSAFGSTSEEVKSVAAFALGSVASGNLDVYLEVIMREMRARPKREYLLLHSLKEVIYKSGYMSLESCLSNSRQVFRWCQLFSNLKTASKWTIKVVFKPIWNQVLQWRYIIQYYYSYVMSRHWFIIECTYQKSHFS